MADVDKKKRVTRLTNGGIHMEFQSKWKRTPKFLALLAIFTTTLFVSLMLTGAKPVNAATKADEITVNSATPKEQAVAKELEKMFVDGDIENLNIDYLIAKYGKDEIQATERFIGISENESRIFPTEHRIVQRDLADIGNCMLGNSVRKSEAWSMSILSWLILTKSSGWKQQRLSLLK